jgi:hypothetical protein
LFDTILPPPEQRITKGPDGEQLTPAEVQVYSYDEERGKALISQAEGGDEYADAALCHLISWHLFDDHPLPATLKRYLLRLLMYRSIPSPKRKRGGNPYANIHRDTFIVHVITVLQKAFRIPPTRNREKRDGNTCGCAIVAEALTQAGGKIVTERAAEEVWAKRGRLSRGERS